MKRIRLGVAPIAWSNDDLHELGGETSLESCLKDMQNIGYEGTELGHKFPSAGPAIKKILSEYHLSLASSWHSTFLLNNNFEDEVLKLKTKLQQLKSAGSSNINICECTGTVHNKINTPLSKRPILNDKDWPTFVKKMNDLGKVCSEYDMTLNYHHHMGTVIQTEKEVDRFLECTDPGFVFLCFDSGHLAFAGADPLACWKKFASRVRHIHLKDVRNEILKNANLHNWSFLKSVMEGVFTVPNDGTIEFRPLISEILSSSYEGWLLVEAEQDPDKANPYVYAKKAYAFIAHLVEYHMSKQNVEARV